MPWITQRGPWDNDFHKVDAEFVELDRVEREKLEILQEIAAKRLPQPIDNKIATSATKPPLAMIPLMALHGVARVFAYGERKHSAGNFLLATLADGAGNRYVSAGMRHATAMQNPDGTWDDELGALDAESGLPHIDHIIATFLMLRCVLIREQILAVDPGLGNEPPKGTNG